MDIPSRKEWIAYDPLAQKRTIISILMDHKLNQTLMPGYTDGRQGVKYRNA